MKVLENFYIIRSIKRGSIPYNTDEVLLDSEKKSIIEEYEILRNSQDDPFWRDKYYPLFHEYYHLSDMIIYVFDSNKEFVWSSVGTTTSYDSIKKNRGEFNFNEIIIKSSLKGMVGIESTISFCEKGVQSGIGNINPMDKFLVNGLRNKDFPSTEKNTVIL